MQVNIDVIKLSTTINNMLQGLFVFVSVSILKLKRHAYVCSVIIETSEREEEYNLLVLFVFRSGHGRGLQ